MNASDFVGLNAPGLMRLSVGSSVLMSGSCGPDWAMRAKAAVVVARVALEGQADRRRMSAMLWPDSDACQVRSNLRVLIHRINQRFGGDMLLGKEQLALDGSLMQVETIEVESVLAALDAGGAERCELLSDAGLEPDAGEELQAWLSGARQRLRQAQLGRLTDALAQALAMGWNDRAAMLARACVQLDPLSEHRHMVLMDVLARAGDRAAALAAYEECKAVLMQQLGVLPGAQTRAAQLNILRDQALEPATETLLKRH